LPNLRKFAASIGVIFVASSSLLFTSPAFADSVSGLNVAVYTYDPSSTPDRITYTPCESAWTHVDNIDQLYDDNNNGIVAGCRDNFVLVHYTGSVTFPTSGTYAFRALADDGFYMTLDETPIITNDWVLKGRWGNIYSDVNIVGGHTYALDAWYYEFTGGANATLTYSPDNGNTWSTVPTEFFTTDGSTPVFTPDPFLNAPTNVQATVDGTDVKVTWDNPQDSGTAVERYAVSWTYDGAPGWGVGVVGNEFTISNLPENKNVTVWVRSDNDTLRVYSSSSDSVNVTTGITPIIVPPVVDPPVVPPVDPPVIPVDPPIVIPVDPPVIVEPPVVDPGQGPDPGPVPPVDKPVVNPEPVLLPPIVQPQVPEVPVETSLPPIASVDPATINPQELTAKEVGQLQAVALETLSTAVEDSPAYTKALKQLYVAAQADDIVVDPQLAAVPVLGAAVVGITNAINAIGNLGSDMSPAHRAKAKKEIIAAVVATGAAVNAVTSAAGAAGAAGSSSGSNSSSNRKKE